MELLEATISFILYFWDFTSLIADLIPLIENSLSIVAILSSFFYFLYTYIVQNNPSPIAPFKKCEKSGITRIETHFVLMSARKKSAFGIETHPIQMLN